MSRIINRSNTVPKIKLEFSIVSKLFFVDRGIYALIIQCADELVQCADCTIVTSKLRLHQQTASKNIANYIEN